MVNSENKKEIPLLEEKPVEEVKEPPKTPESTATGNEKVTILKHSLFRAIDEGVSFSDSIGAQLAIRNVSDSTIANAVFEAAFYDIEGNIIDTVKHREVDLKPSASRGILINSSVSKFHLDEVKGYNIKITRMTTADVEKVQVRAQEIRTIGVDEDEVRGTVKNISNVKTDAALIATFYDYKEENIGARVIILRDIEPNTVRQYRFLFKPQAGDKLRRCTLHIGEIVE